MKCLPASSRWEFPQPERRQRISSAIPTSIRTSPSAIQRQEPPHRSEMVLVLVGSAGGWVCNAFEAIGWGVLVPSGVGTGAVPVAEASVGGTAVKVCARVGVGLLPVGSGVGEWAEVAVLVAVAAPGVCASVGVDDGAKAVGEGVSDGTLGGSVGV